MDGREADELRPIKITPGIVEGADGSALVEWGGNKVLSMVYGPREAYPKHRQNPTRAIIHCRYNMSPFSVKDRKKPGYDRRSIEISKQVSEVFTNVVFTQNYPRAAIDVHVEVLQADGGTRCASITASSVALADAGIPMKGLVSACAAGKLEGKMAVDLTGKEDSQGDADMPVAVINDTDSILLLQMDGDLTQGDIRKGMDMCLDGCRRVAEIQRECLLSMYSMFDDEGTGTPDDPEKPQQTASPNDSNGLNDRPEIPDDLEDPKLATRDIEQYLMEGEK